VHIVPEMLVMMARLRRMAQYQIAHKKCPTHFRPTYFSVKIFSTACKKTNTLMENRFIST